MKTAWDILREESIAAMCLAHGKDEALEAAYKKYIETTKELENENNNNSVTQSNNS
jgi:hypothetical protein